MKQLTQYIQEKLHISNYKEEKYKVGDIIDNYELNGRKYNLVCCISGNQIKDNIPRFIVDDETECKWGSDISIKSVDKNDINGKENTNKIIINSKGCNDDIAAVEIINNFNSKVYLPSIGELDIIYKNINKIKNKLKNIDFLGVYWSSSQYSESQAYTCQFNVLRNNIYHNYKYIPQKIFGIIQIK